MSNNRVMTAPLAVIKVGGEAVALMKNIRVTETFRRVKVSGLGQFTPKERPPVEWDGTLSCSFYSIDLQRTGVPGAVKRTGLTVQEYVDELTIFDEDGIDIVIYKKTKDGFNVYANVKANFANRESFDISEGQVAGQDVEFSYNVPILFDE